MTILESVVLKLSLFLVCAVLFTACATMGTRSPGSTPAAESEKAEFVPRAFRIY